jgi:hypothetical protein
MGHSALFKKDATFHAHLGLMGGGVSFRSFNYPQHFLMHDKVGKGKTYSDVWIRKYKG